MNTPIYQVDSFTSVPFRGNPAGVCILDALQSDAWLQNVAMEMNLSETAFLLPEGGAWRLRWFTPRVEVDLCGHATLASAHILWESGREPQDTELHFNSRSGLLKANLNEGWIELDFPKATVTPSEPPDFMLSALGVDKALFVGFDGTDFLVEIESDAQLRALAPDMGRLEKTSSRGVIVTARSTDPQYDFISRFFGPQVGIPEDPVTGSAHCALSPYWAAKLGKTTFTAYQASARGGELRPRILGERVIIGGQAVTVIEGLLKG
jgi:PhzF family phenazine biosynthesis protein